jgi:hypothetical protein
MEASTQLNLCGIEQEISGFFFESYEIYKEIMTKDLIKKTAYGNRIDNKCRFCKKEEPEVTFTEDTHLIPELLGNHYLYSQFECDSCNHLFDKCEDSLGKFLDGVNTLSQVKGKRGIPTTKATAKKIVEGNEAEQQILRIEDSGDGMEIVVDSESNLVEVNDALKQLKVTIPGKSFTPVLLFRALVKVGYSLLEEKDLPQFEELREWLVNLSNDEENSRLSKFLLIHILVPGADYPPSVILFRKKIGEEKRPDLVMMLLFKNQIFQFALPFSAMDLPATNSGKKLQFLRPPFPISVEMAAIGIPKITALSVEGHEKTRGRRTIELTYDSGLRAI